MIKIPLFGLWWNDVVIISNNFGISRGIDEALDTHLNLCYKEYNDKENEN